jgi:transposase-like protein
MSGSIISDKHFHDEEAAYAWVEARVWPKGPVCPHCKGTERISKMQGKSTRVGTYKCYACRKPFTVKIRTIFEASHVPMRHWLQAIFLMSSSKKGISSNQLHRTLGCTLKTAWFISHRIREAMRAVGVTPMGGAGAIIEADETFIGRLEGIVGKSTGGWAHKNVVLTLVQRGGSARSFHIASTSIADVVPIVRQNIRNESRLMTDEARHYIAVGQEFKDHGAVNHSAYEWKRGDIHTNTVEGYYSIFKRGMKGVYQHCKEKHLHRYLAEFDFRYNNRIGLGINDVARAEQALKGIVGKRLTYRTANH